MRTKTYHPEVNNEKSFYDAIHRSLKTSEHKDALLEIVKEFEQYKKFMSENLIPANLPSNKIFLFRFTYQLKKNVWKDVEIYGDQTLEFLATFVIDEMGWNNDHLHAFFFGEKRGKVVFSHWYTPYEIGSEGMDNDQYPILHTNEVFVSSVDFSKHPKLGFVFDFGDDHRFMMEYKGMRDAHTIDTKESFPRVTDQRGVGPEQYPDYNTG